MKRFFLSVMVLSLVLPSCKPESKKSDFTVLQNTSIALSVAGKQSKAVGVLADSATAHFIVRYAYRINGVTDSVVYWSRPDFPMVDPHSEEKRKAGTAYSLGQDDPQGFQRDTVNHIFYLGSDALFWWDEMWLPPHIIGTFVGFEHAVVVVSRDEQGKICDPMIGEYGKIEDTVGYIPSSVMQDNLRRVQQYVTEERYEDIVRIFTSDYVIYPCTGEEYRELVRQGLN